MARSEKSLLTDEYAALLLKAISEQTSLCNEIMKKADAIISSSVKINKNSENGSLNFTQKEIRSMPSLKDCKIRFHKGVYEIRYRKHGYNKTFYHKTLAGAKDKARSFMSQINNKIKKIYAPVVTTKKNSLNAAKYCENWLKNVKARQLKEITFNSLFNKYKKHMEPTLKKFHINDLTSSTIQKIFDSVTTRNAEDIRTIFNGVFNYAIANNLIDRSPMSVVVVKKHEREKGERLSREQEIQFLKKIKGHEKETTIKLYLYTGARPSELETIKFDWKNGTFTLHNSKLKSYQKEQTRTIPIFPTLYDMKDEIEKAEIFNATSIGKYFRKYFPGYQVKTLRHTFTSKCKEQKVSSELVNYWTGHTIGNDTSAKIYTHFDIDFQKEEAKKITW